MYMCVCVYIYINYLLKISFKLINIHYKKTNISLKFYLQLQLNASNLVLKYIYTITKLS